MRNEQSRNINGYVKIAKALADTGRMRVAAALMRHEELCVCQLTELLDLAISTVSRHVNLLHDARIVNSRKQGKWVYYSLSTEIPPLIRSWLENDILNTRQAKKDRQKLSTILTKTPGYVCKDKKERNDR